jgi:3-oxoacyl-[acyl-carrier protein] reductase
MELTLKGKRALVCGSTQGIGKAIALMFAEAGASVMLVARDETALKKVCDELTKSPEQSHHTLAVDFSHPEKLKEKLEEKFSSDSFSVMTYPIHILVNNTGGPAGGAITEATSEEFLAAFSKHLLCNQILVQAVLAGMKTEKYGRIVNIISTSVKQPIPNLGVSNATRAAVASWAKTLAGEVAAFGITINNILPGATETARLAMILKNKSEKSGKTISQIEAEERLAIPAHRFGTPNEIAYAALFLASPLAAYITGINLPVDGGRTLAL